MGRDDDFRCRWLKHPLRNFQRGSTWRSNYDPLTAPNRVVDDLQFLPRISVESIVNRNSGTIGILKGCWSSTAPVKWFLTRESRYQAPVRSSFEILPLPLTGDSQYQEVTRLRANSSSR